MKKNISFAVILFCSVSVFAQDFSATVRNAVSKIIPKNASLVQVELPVDSETNSASEFTVFLKDVIEVALSDCGKEIFDLKADQQSELFLAQLSDSGVYDMSSSDWAKRQFPEGVIYSSFIEKDNKVSVYFSYKQFAGNTKKTSVEFSTKNLPGLNYKPANYELAKSINEDFVRNIPKPDYLITAAMLDSEGNLVNMLYPNDIVKFMISGEKDSYIAILCIDANGDKNWLPVENNFIRAGEVRTFPDLKGTVFKVVDGVYGAEQILIYASTSEKGLPEQTSTGKYARNDIQKITRGIMAVKQSSAENYETSVFKITYTVME